MWHDSFTALTGRDACCKISMTWRIHMCGITHAYACKDSFIRVDMLDSYVLICLTHTCWYVWLIRVDMLDGIYTAYPTRCLMQYMYDMTDSCVTWLNHTRDGHIWSRNGDRTWLVHMCLFVWQEMMHRALRTRCLLHYMYDMNHLPLWHDSIKHMTTIFDHATATRHGKFKCGHMCDTTSSQCWLDETLAAKYIWDDWLIRAIWLNHTRDMRYDSIIHVTWLFDRTRPMHMSWYSWHDSFTHAWHDCVLISLTWLIHICLTWLIHIVYQTRCLPQDV